MGRSPQSLGRASGTDSKHHGVGGHRGRLGAPAIMAVAPPVADATGAVVLAILDAEDGPDFPRAVCRAIHDHMDVRRVSMGQYHPRLRRFRASYWPPMRAEVEERLLGSYGADLALHPRIHGSADPAGATDVAAWHDLPPDHAFFRTRLYRDFYLPQGVTDQITIAVAGPEDVAIGVSLDRVAGSFTDAEKDMLRAIQRCLESIFRRQSGSQLGSVLRSVGWTRIVADPGGEVVTHDAPEGQPSLAPGTSLAAMPWWPDVRAALEQDLVLNGTMAPDVRTVISNGTTLVVERSLLQDPVIHLLGDPQDPAVVSTDPRRLTRRQVEVARLLVDGRSAREIAAHLHISLATARSHIEHVYRRLEVTNRAQAVACLLTSTELD